MFRLPRFLFLTCTRIRSLTSHLQIDECLNLKVLSHVVAQRTPPWAIPEGYFPARQPFWLASPACPKKSNLWVSIYEAPASIRVCWQLPGAPCSAADCLQDSDGDLKLCHSADEHLDSGAGLNVAPAVDEQLNTDGMTLCPFTPGWPEEVGLIMRECKRQPHLPLVRFTFTPHF